MSTPAGKRGRWFLPDTPDVIGMLRRQAAITADGMAAFAAWAAGDTARADDVRRAEHECDEARRTLVDAISEAFTTPLEPEDLFQLSFELDRVINGAKNTVRESEAMQFPPDASSAQMAALLVEGVQHLRAAFAQLDGSKDRQGRATQEADAAVRSQRQLERVYREAMSQLLDVTDIRVVLGSRELYRRMTSMSDDIVSVADRVWYSRVKES
ncbi:MAG: DUF47 family protein [Actinomycetales bacterium]|nr:DUF47 family protein [Actinomycetales bacterium]